jgi:hypothetical protein
MIVNMCKITCSEIVLDIRIKNLWVQKRYVITVCLHWNDTKFEELVQRTFLFALLWSKWSGMISSLKHVNQLKVIPILNNYPYYNQNEKDDHTNKLVENDYNISLKNRPHKLGICYTVLHRESLKAPRAVRE